MKRYNDDDLKKANSVRSFTEVVLYSTDIVSSVARGKEE